MDHELDAEALTALGHPGRLAVFRLLARRAPHGVRPSEIAEALDLKPNTLSVYVTTLTRAGILTTWREGRSVYYGIDLKRVGTLVDFLVNDCCRGRPDLCEPLAARSLQRLAAVRAGGARNVLFVCSGNSARSQFAEAILNRNGNGRFRAYSAGTKPNRRLNPEAVSVLTARGHDTDGLKPKAVADFERPGAPVMDYVITVCDQAANEDCPPLPGLPLTAHWGISRPSAVEGADRAAAFATAYDAIQQRLERFAALPVETLDALSLQSELDAIGGSRAGKGA
ncbi:helix-turn-helix domain-containing protein [Acuticoccus sp. I52.16.1]|uniref:arsenate reductase/protein-tyrosine-phosphatase family protein n=1 Tax=Acuticoccus sp. I52.16.1 TaxID=2928472 RepID=UPI001FD2FF3A|nr:helix-turn-helix domain-containing protein [Acuticoccus sp. I52.16.1]UOM34435.1 helix-turn-helix domain-containing protein [Acuticoccus sp. I52.16.1]